MRSAYQTNFVVLLVALLGSACELESIEFESGSVVQTDVDKETSPTKEPQETPKQPIPKTPNDTTAIQTFFTTTQLVYPDVPEERSPQEFELLLLEDINNAKKSIYAVTFEYNLDSIKEALIRAKKRKLNVRVALDGEHLQEKEDMALWAENIEKAKIPISFEKSTSFSHSKFIVIDDSIVWTGSWNFTQNDTYRNNNNILRITIPELVKNYTTEFLQMDSGYFGTKKKAMTPNPIITKKTIEIENYFSPKDNVLEKILPYIKGAKKSIQFLTFSYTEDTIGQEMIERNNAGVSVVGVFESRNASGLGSEMEILQNAGIDVLSDGNCYTMHHKVIIIDKKIVITGSYNFTKRAEEINDENLLIIKNEEIARLYVEEFNRVYEQAKKPTKCGKSKS